MYVLIGVVLFAALSFVLMRQSETGGGESRLSDDKAKLVADQLIAYATTTKAAVEQMRVMQNVLPTEFDFTKPDEAGFGTAPYTAKVFHPAGGGINLFNATDDMFASGSAKRGWVAQTGTNVEWSTSTASDIILSFVDVATPVCKAINQRLYKESSVPASTVSTPVVSIHGGGDDGDFALSDCPSCNQRVSYCIKDTDGVNVFYNLILVR